MEEIRKEFEKKTGLATIIQDDPEDKNTIYYSGAYGEFLEKEVVSLRHQLTEETEEGFNTFVQETIEECGLYEQDTHRVIVHSMMKAFAKAIFTHYKLIKREK